MIVLVSTSVMRAIVADCSLGGAGERLVPWLSEVFKFGAPWRYYDFFSVRLSKFDPLSTPCVELR